MTAIAMDQEQLKATIRDAFKDAEYPGDWCLRGSNEGNEPILVEKEFKGKTKWESLNAEFLDQAPEGYGSALSFFSDEAFHFYLPAYLIADIDCAFQRADPLYHLTHGFDDASKNERINPRRYGERRWSDYAQHKFAMFNSNEVKAIIAYLDFKASASISDREIIRQALDNYWLRRDAENEK